MMELKKFLNKKVYIDSTDNRVVGTAKEYIRPDENRPKGVEGIVLYDVPGYDRPLKFNASDIRLIGTVDNDLRLRQYVNEKVRLIDTNGDEYVGFVGDYIYPEDNEPEGIEEIILEQGTLKNGEEIAIPICFCSPEIKSIETVE